jgi:hypothetical protein
MFILGGFSQLKRDEVQEQKYGFIQEYQDGVKLDTSINISSKYYSIQSKSSTKNKNNNKNNKNRDDTNKNKSKYKLIKVRYKPRSSSIDITSDTDTLSTCSSMSYQTIDSFSD